MFKSSMSDLGFQGLTWSARGGRLDEPEAVAHQAGQPVDANWAKLPDVQLLDVKLGMSNLGIQFL